MFQGELLLITKFWPLSFRHELVPEFNVGIDKVPSTAKEENKPLSLGHEGSYLIWAVELAQRK